MTDAIEYRIKTDALVAALVGYGTIEMPPSDSFVDFELGWIEYDYDRDEVAMRLDRKPNEEG